MSYRLLFLGDVVGRPGRDALERDLPSLIKRLKPLFVVANGENAAGGVGITAEIAESMLSRSATTRSTSARFSRTSTAEPLSFGPRTCRPATRDGDRSR